MVKVTKFFLRLPGRARLALAGLAAALCILAWPAFTWAHPLGNFTVNRYSRLELGPERVTVYYVVDMAEIPAFQERVQIDLDQDGAISPAEQAQYLAGRVAGLRDNLELRLDGTALRLEPQEQRLEFPPGQGGLPTLRLSVTFSAPLPQPPRPRQAEYRDDNYAGRLGWQEIVVRAAGGVNLVESSAPAQDLSQELRRYPEELLQSPPRVSRASFRFEPGAGKAGETSEVLETSEVWQSPRSSDPFARLITLPALGPGSLLLALLAAFGWGAAHALTPGHGKTIVAAYLVGSRGTTRHALFLGLTTTLTHTAGVFALGFVTLLVSEFILPEQLYPWLGVASGLLVVAIGLSLFRGRLAALFNPRGHGQAQHSHPHEHDHQHDHHHHDHHRHGDHDHRHGDHDHLPPGADGSPVTWRSLLLLGVSGGLLPCPSALVVMLGAIALQRIGLGLLLILAFSLGLAGVLTAVGILFVHAGRLFEQMPRSGRVVRLLPAASAFFVTCAGLGITWRALVEAGLLRI